LDEPVPRQLGSIFSVFHIGADKLSVNCNLIVCRSKDQGRTWVELPFRFETRISDIDGCIPAGELVEVEPGRLMLICTWYDRSDPKRPVFDPDTLGIIPSKQLAAFSDDDGESWSPWHEIPTAGLKGCNMAGPLLKWADGTVAFPFESYKKDPGDPEHGIHGAYVTLSGDGGRTFGNARLVAQHPQHQVFYWDMRACVGKSNGEFIALFWTHDLTHKKDLNVHMRKCFVSKTGIAHGPLRQTQIVGSWPRPSYWRTAVC